MRYKILNGEEVVNIIEASPQFCEAYCKENNYNFRECPFSNTRIEPMPEPEPTDTEVLNTLLGVSE